MNITPATKVLLLQNSVSPYRLPVFEALAGSVDLTVVYGKEKDSSRFWKDNFREYKFAAVVLPHWQLGPFVINKGVFSLLGKGDFDCFILTENEENISTIMAIALYCLVRRKKIIVWSGRVELNKQLDAQAKRGLLLTIAKRLFDAGLAVYQRLLYKCAASFVSYSPASTDFLAARGVARSKVFEGTQVMPQVLLPAAPAPKSHQGLSILYLGYLKKIKGVDNLINAVKQIDSKTLRVDIVGAGDDAEELKALAATDERIHFHAYADAKQKAEWYTNADLFIFPTLHDPWAHVITESLYYGLPVVTTTAAGGTMLIKEGVNGYVIQPGSVNDIVTVIQRAIANPQLIGELKKGVANNLDKSYYNPATAVATFLAALQNAK